MADVRSMLKNERATRRIQHPYASYSTAGTLLCTVCHLQIKSESLWEGHLRSAGHIMRAQKRQEANEATPTDDGNKKKRKASDDDGDVDTIRKRSKASNPSLPEGFFDAGNEEEQVEVVPMPKIPIPTPTRENQMNIPSRPATPLKPTHEIPTRPEANVNEDEWAAFVADIAATEAQPEPVMIGNGEGVISAPAMTAAELKQKDAEEENKRRSERAEAEAEGDKEDAARKLEDEFEQMESLEERVRRLREKREALRKGTAAPVAAAEVDARVNGIEEGDAEEDEEDDEDDEDDDDDWNGFRMKG